MARTFRWGYHNQHGCRRTFLGDWSSSLLCAKSGGVNLGSKVVRKKRPMTRKIILKWFSGWWSPLSVLETNNVKIEHGCMEWFSWKLKYKSAMTMRILFKKTEKGWWTRAWSSNWCQLVSCRLLGCLGFTTLAPPHPRKQRGWEYEWIAGTPSVSVLFSSFSKTNIYIYIYEDINTYLNIYLQAFLLFSV